MMEKLLKLAKKVADQVEIYSITYQTDSVSFENSRLKAIDSKIQDGIALRIVKDGKLGFAYTRNLLSREELIENALASIKGGVAAQYQFPLTKKITKLNSFDTAIKKVTNKQMVEECRRICEILGTNTKAEIHTSLEKAVQKIRLINSSGTDLTTQFSEFSGYAGILYPGSHAAIFRILYSKKFEQFPDHWLNLMVALYSQSLKEAKPKTGRMKVLFMPETLYALIWRLKEATNSKNIYEQVSPIKDKLNQKILSEKLTVVDEPLNDNLPNARAFDDEGMPCQNLTIIEAGVFKNFYTDLNYATKLKVEPTGNGYKANISSKITPMLNHLTIRPGQKSFEELIKMIDKGIIACGIMGAHSGNILNGDFSVGLAPGIYVENGEIVGQVKDAMVAGNIYEVMNNVVEIEDTLYPSFTGMASTLGSLPAILFADVSVAMKNS
ncbi:MAG: TldD/PmbA family protein [candidate division WOR-3 bacterium]